MSIVSGENRACNGTRYSPLKIMNRTMYDLYVSFPDILSRMTIHRVLSIVSGIWPMHRK